MRGNEELGIRLGHLSVMTTFATDPQPVDMIAVNVHQSKVNKQGEKQDMRYCMPHPDPLQCGQANTAIHFAMRQCISENSVPFKYPATGSGDAWCGDKARRAPIEP